MSVVELFNLKSLEMFLFYFYSEHDIFSLDDVEHIIEECSSSKYEIFQL